MSWGIAAPESAPVSWGARAIFQQQTIDLLPDRMVMGKTGSESERQALIFWINRYGLPHLRELVKKLMPYESGQSNYGSHGFYIVASPKASHGYLYIGAWATESPVVMPPAPRLWTSSNELWWVEPSDVGSSVTVVGKGAVEGKDVRVEVWRSTDGVLQWMPASETIPKYVKEKVGALIPKEPNRFQRGQAARRSSPNRGSTFMDDEPFRGGRRVR